MIQLNVSDDFLAWWLCQGVTSVAPKPSIVMYCPKSGRIFPWAIDRDAYRPK